MLTTQPIGKTSYHMKNWSEYDKSLRKRGGQPIYSEIAIETLLTLRRCFLRERFILSFYWGNPLEILL